MKDDLGRNCKTGGLPGQQARPQGENAYSEESGESEDDSTADGGKVLPRLESWEKSQIWFNKHALDSRNTIL